MSDTLERLREYLAEKDRLQEDVSVLDTDELRLLLDIAEAAQRLYDTHEIQMYVGHDAVAGGHIGYCSRQLGAALAALDSTGGAER